MVEDEAVPAVTVKESTLEKSDSSTATAPTKKEVENASMNSEKGGKSGENDAQNSTDSAREVQKSSKDLQGENECNAHRQARKERWQKNVKSDLTSQPESSDPEEIRKQVEFYFSNSNLPYDKFLYSKVEGSKNTAIPIKIVHDFKRMRRFQPYSAVVAALRDSTLLEVVEGELIRRREPLAEIEGKSAEESVKIYEDKAQPRSVYVKGFGEEGPSTQFDIEAFFAPYGPTNAIRLRRTFPDKIFKGSVFVEFENEEMQQAFLTLDPKPKFKGKELMILSKKAYCDTKANDIKSGKIKANEGRRGRGGRRGGRGGDRDGRRGKGRDGNREQKQDARIGDKDEEKDEDDKDWKSSRDKFQKNGFRDLHGRRGSGRGRGDRNRDRDRNRSGEGRDVGDELGATAEDGQAGNATDKDAMSSATTMPVAPLKENGEEDEHALSAETKKRSRDGNDADSAEKLTKKVKGAQDVES